MKTLVVVGAGGHGQMCADLAEQVGDFASIVYSDDAYARGALACRWTVKYHDEDLSSIDSGLHEFVVGVGQLGTGAVRETIFNRIIAAGLSPAALIAPNSSVSATSTIGRGTVIGFMSTVNVGAAIGTNVIVNTHAIVEHDAKIGDHVHISTGAIVNGGATVGARCLIGTGATVLQGISICADAVVGAGSVVTRELDSPGTYVGVPARKTHD